MNVRRLSNRINGAADRIETTIAFDKPFVTGARRTWRRDSHARSVIVATSSDLPMAPAVVPRVAAPRPTATRSTIVAARLIPDDFVGCWFCESGVC